MQLSFEFSNVRARTKDAREGISNRTSRNELVELLASQPNLAELEQCAWSASVALDPKHRPQKWNQPSSTLRREWCRYPQEAHLLDEERWRYRRLTSSEMALLQGFDPSWFAVPRLSNLDRIRAIGDAVPPPLAKAILGAIDSKWNWTERAAVEICAGAGGLASAISDRARLEHTLLVDRWSEPGLA
jgi:site-specific DNA-cytosine methylase